MENNRSEPTGEKTLIDDEKQQYYKRDTLIND